MSHRLLFVTGKGGVGRSSVSAAIALAAGMQGKRTLCVELNGLADVGRRLGAERSYEPVSIGENTDWRSLTARECVMDFARRKLRLGGVGVRVMGSKTVQRFLNAIPGLTDLLQLGKIENLLNEPLPGDTAYDLVVVDCPATGHGLTLLDAPQTMTEVSRAGPFHDLARIISEALTDGTSGVIVVSLPERLPLSETLELLDAVEERPVPIAGVLVNRLREQPVPDVEAWPQVAASLTQHTELVALTEGLVSAWRGQCEVLQRLRMRTQVRTIPDVGPGATPADIAPHLEVP